jgi:hypothetical protein
VHFNIRPEGGRQCILVLMGATAEGKKELIAIADGYRESEQSWKELLLDCKARGLEIEPGLAIGDGALGFWKAMRQVWDTTREQRCWVHTIRAQSVFGRFGTPRTRRQASERDHVPDLQRVLPHDHTLDQHLQERLPLRQRRPVQSGADPLAKGGQVRQDHPGLRRSLAETLLLLPLHGQHVTALLDPSPALAKLLQADGPALVGVDQPPLLVPQPLELRLELPGHVGLARALLRGEPGHIAELRQQRLRVG